MQLKVEAPGVVEVHGIAVGESKGLQSVLLPDCQFSVGHSACFVCELVVQHVGFIDLGAIGAVLDILLQVHRTALMLVAT